MAQSYLPVTSQTSGAAAEAEADRKTAKYAPLTQVYSFIPIAAETMGAINSDGITFLDDLGRRINQVTDDNREKAFFYQWLSVLIQRYNAVAILSILFGWLHGVMVNIVGRMNEVNQRRARLVLGWVTIFRWLNHLGM